MDAEAEASSKLTTDEERMKVVGSRIEVWWSDDEEFYEAIIESYDPREKAHKVVYDDGTVERLKLNEERWKFVNGKKKKESINDPDRASPADSSYEMPMPNEAQTPEEVVRYVNVIKTLNLRVDRFVNIDDVKDRFSEFEGIETNLQKVFLTEGAFQNDQKLDFERKDVDGSNVHLNLHLGVRFQVFVKVSWSTDDADKIISLDVHSWNTISDLKSKFQDKEGTPANQLTLIYNGKQLDDDLQTLAGYAIGNHSTLDVFSLGEEKIVVFVNPPAVEPIKVIVKLCSTVVNLKRMIHCMRQFPVDRQKLTFNGVLLENDQRLADYKMQMVSVLGLDLP